MATKGEMLRDSTGVETPDRGNRTASRNAIYIAGKCTVAWMVLLGLMIVAARFGANNLISYEHYVGWRTLGAAAMLAIGIWTVFKTALLVVDGAGKKWYADPLLLTSVVFWAIFPPMWFFTEYYSFDQTLISLPREFTDRKEFLASLKEYAGFSASIWAGFGALLLLLIAKAEHLPARRTD